MDGWVDGWVDGLMDGWVVSFWCSSRLLESLDVNFVREGLDIAGIVFQVVYLKIMTAIRTTVSLINEYRYHGTS